MRLRVAVAVCAALALGGGKASAHGRLDVGLLRTAQLSIEGPFIASPAFTVVPARASLPLEYASLYLTPGGLVIRL